jgi:hypothetical protein
VALATHQTPFNVSSASKCQPSGPSCLSLTSRTLASGPSVSQTIVCETGDLVASAVWDDGGVGEATLAVGDRVRILGGYESNPEWLGQDTEVWGRVVRWIPGQNTLPACVVHLDESLTVFGLVGEQRLRVTGKAVGLEQRFVGAQWTDEGTVHVELCGFEPEAAPWEVRQKGAWVESHATYQRDPSRHDR